MRRRLHHVACLPLFPEPCPTDIPPMECLAGTRQFSDLSSENYFTAYSLAACPDGTCVAVAGYWRANVNGSPVLLFDAADGRHLATFPLVPSLQPSSPVYLPVDMAIVTSMSWSGDSSRLAVTGVVRSGHPGAAGTGPLYGWANVDVPSDGHCISAAAVILEGHSLWPVAVMRNGAVRHLWQ